MKKKKKQSISPLQDSKKQLMRLQAFASAHLVVLLFIVGGGVVSYSLLRARTYLSPVRNEVKYNELSTSIVYKRIDYKIVEKLQDSLTDTDVTVDAQLPGNRRNPFNE